MKNTRNCLYFWCKHVGPVFENRINSEKCVKNKTTFTLTTFKVVTVKVVLFLQFSKFLPIFRAFFKIRVLSMPTSRGEWEISGAGETMFFSVCPRMNFACQTLVLT